MTRYLAKEHTAKIRLMFADSEAMTERQKGVSVRTGM